MPYINVKVAGKLTQKQNDVENKKDTQIMQMHVKLTQMDGVKQRNLLQKMLSL